MRTTMFSAKVTPLLIAFRSEQTTLLASGIERHSDADRQAISNRKDLTNEERNSSDISLLFLKKKFLLSTPIHYKAKSARYTIYIMKHKVALIGYLIFVVSYAVSSHLFLRANAPAAQHALTPQLSVVPGGQEEPFPEIILPPSKKIESTVIVAPAPNSSTFSYIEVTNGCSAYFEGGCVNVRSGPSTSSPVIAQLRSGAVLQTTEKISAEGREWYKVVFNEWLRYPERVAADWFVAAEYARAFENEGILHATTTTPTTSKSIIVDRGEQKLYAYDGDVLFMEESVSTGNDLTPTPRGTFSIFRKTPSRYMQGPLPDISDDYYDLPGVPWNLYFTAEGAAIHGAYWHDKFGQRWSHGCVNLLPDNARKLYEWADVGTQVTVRD